MKFDLTEHYLSKLTNLVMKFHQEQVSLADLIQLKILIAALKSHTNGQESSLEIANILTKIAEVVEISTLEEFVPLVVVD